MHEGKRGTGKVEGLPVEETRGKAAFARSEEPAGKVAPARMGTPAGKGAPARIGESAGKAAPACAPAGACAEGGASGATVPRGQRARAWAAVVREELTCGWPRWSSFACIWLWSCLVGKTYLTTGALSQLTGMLAVPTAVTLLANVATLVVIVFLSDSLATIVGSRGAMTLSGILLAGGSVGLCASAYTGDPALFVAGSSMGGAAIGFLKIAWGEMFSRMSLRRGLVDMGLSLVVSTALFLALFACPREAQVVALVACALPCSWLAWEGTRRLGDSPTPPPPPGAARAVSFSWTLLILPAIVGFAFGLMSAVLAARHASTAALVGPAVAELAAGALLLAASLALSPRLGAAQIYALGLIGTAAGAALASVQAMPAWVAASVNELGFAVFYFFMVVYWGDLARRVNRPVVRTYALGYLVFQASQLPGLALGDAFGHGSGQEALALVFLAVVLALFVAVLLVFSDPRGALHQWLAAGEPAESGDEIPEACAELAGRSGLTPREREVLSLLARGRTAAYVGRSLGISPDTAKTHIRSVYRKMDIHTQQDLMDLIEAEAARQRAGQATQAG